MKTNLLLCLIISFNLSVSFYSVASDFVVTTQKISGGNRFQAIAIDEKGGLWVSGTKSAVYHSNDLGKTWSAVNTPKLEKALQFRDIDVVGDKIVLMSAGEGADSRLYMSDDLGKSWQLSRQGQSADTFYDCFSMTSPSTGWLYGDSTDNQFAILKTTDGANSWQEEVVPFKAQDSEGGFASSGTCLVSNSQGDIAIGTGNATTPRLLIKNKGQAWKTINSPYIGGEAAGIFSVQFDDDSLYTFGGSLKAQAPKPQAPKTQTSKAKKALGYRYSIESASWLALPELPFTGAVYGSAITKEHIFVSNPQGISVLDKSEFANGKNQKTAWRTLSTLDMWAMACKENKCWAVGANDTIVTISW